MPESDNEFREFVSDDKVWNEIKDRKIGDYVNFSNTQLDRLKANIDFLLSMRRKHGSSASEGE